jgi:hypothetical protein
MRLTKSVRPRSGMLGERGWLGLVVHSSCLRNIMVKWTTPSAQPFPISRFRQQISYLMLSIYLVHFQPTSFLLIMSVQLLHLIVQRPRLLIFIQRKMEHPYVDIIYIHIYIHTYIHTYIYIYIYISSLWLHAYV